MLTLLQAIQQLNVAEVSRLIADKIDLNKPCSNGELPLKIAILQTFDRSLSLNKDYEKCLQIIDLLLKAGAIIKIINFDNKNILHFLSSQRDRDLLPWLDKTDQKTISNKVTSEEVAKIIMEMILNKEHMLDFNQRDEYGNTPFLSALSHGNKNIAKLLIAHGADVTVKDNRGNTALHLVGQKDVELFKLLLSKDIDVNAIDGRGLTILDVVNNPDLILALLRRGAKATQLDMFNFFSTAQRTNHIDLIEYLYANGLVTYVNVHSQNALYYADSCEQLKRLLKSGVSINANAQYGSIVFFHILSNLHKPEELLNRLIIFRKYNADFSVKDKEGKSLLQHAIYADKIVFSTLIEVVLINVQDAKGNTALHDAASAFLCDKIELLIKHKADCTLRNQEGLLALEKFNYMFINRNKDFSYAMCANVLSQLLVALPENVLPTNSGDLLLIAICCDSLEIIQNLFKRGASITAHKEPYGYNAIECAAYDNKIIIFNWMLTKVLEDPNKDSILKGILFFAVKAYRYEIIKIILKLEININDINEKGETILSSFIQDLDVRLNNHYATDEEQQFATVETFKSLIEANIDINLCNIPPSSPQSALEELLHKSRRNNKYRWPFILILIKHDAKLPDNFHSLFKLANLAVEYNDLDTVELIINKCTLEVWKQEILFSVAEKFIAKGDTNALDRLLKLGLTFNRPSRLYLSQGVHRTLLEEVLNPSNHLTLVQPAENESQKQYRIERLLGYILANDKDMHYPHRTYGYSLLHIAVVRGFLGIVQTLLTPPFQYEVDLLASSPEDNELVTPLQLAVKKDFVEIAKALLAHKANPVVLNRINQTLLHIACDNGSIAMTELLLQTAINKDALHVRQMFMYEQKLSSVHYAALYKDRLIAEKLVNILLDHKVKVDAILLASIIQNQFSADTFNRVIKLLSKNEILEHRLLHLAVKVGNLTACQILISYFPELINSQNAKGCYPLHIATEADRKDIFNYLLSVKANIHVSDYEGYDIISYAICHDTFENLGLSNVIKVNYHEIHLLRAQLIENQEFKKADANLLFSLMQYCYKLISLFKSAGLTLKFIARYQNTSSKQPIHDLCLFQLPSISNNVISSWNQNEWLKLIMSYGTELTQYIHLAPRIEFLLKRVPADLGEIKKTAADIKYNRESENSKLAELFIEHRIREDAFNRALDSFKIKINDFIPDIFIDGKEFNEPRFYLKKLPVNDLRGYVLGSYTHCCQHVGAAGEACAVHGMTSPYGGFFVVFKRANPEELEKKLKILHMLEKATTGEEFLNNFKEKSQRAQREKYKKQLQEAGSLKQLRNNFNIEYKLACKEEIVAQCWAWISINNSLVLDSWERLREEDDRLCKPFIDRLAKLALTHPSINCVLLGKGGQTPSNLNYKVLSIAEYPKDYYNYRDSGEQYLIKAKNDVALAPEPNTKILSQGIGLFSQKEEIKAIDYKKDEIDILLKYYLANLSHIMLLNSIDSSDKNFEETISQLKIFKDAKVNDPNIINVCILPILTLERLWSVLILEKGKNIFDFSKDDWIIGKYIDFSAKSLSHQFNQLLVKAGITQGLSYMDGCRVVYNTNPSVSGAWLVENLKIFDAKDDFSFLILDNSNIKNIKTTQSEILEKYRNDCDISSVRSEMAHLAI